MSTDVKQALDMLTNSTNGSLHTDETEDSDADSDESTSVGADDSDNDTASEDGQIGEDEFDMGFDDLDFISKGHQSKSLSMPTIHFGNEDDPSAEASRVTSRHDSPEASTPPVVSPRQSRTLYIQMEVRARITCLAIVADRLEQFVSGQTLREVGYRCLHPHPS